MARPLRIEDAGAHDQVMNRGNRRPTVFAAAQDCTLFLARLLCHCCPSNHFSLCLRTECSGRLGQKSSRN